MPDHRREAKLTTADELDRLAEPRLPEDEERAREAAKRHGSRRFLEMLDAQPEDDE